MPTISGTTGGAFSATGGISFISTATGEIDVSLSTPGGPYTVIYTTPGPDCPNFSSTTVEILPADVPVIEYAPSSYCVNGLLNPTPTIMGLPGGTFSETTGTLTFIDVFTGEIDAAAASSGLFIIEYLTSGPCPEIGDFTIEFLPLIDPDFVLDDTICLPTAAIPLDAGITLSPGQMSSFYSYGPDGAASLTGGASPTLLPNTSGPGNYFITHLVSNGTCSDSSTQEVVILPEYISDYTNPDTLCEAEGIEFNLNTLFNGSTSLGGIWEGSNVYNDSLWDVTGLFDFYSISYMVGEGICADTTTQSVFIQSDVDSAWNILPKLCVTDAPVHLNLQISGTPGGDFSGLGVDTNWFAPDAAGVGIHDITYLVGSSPCQEQLTQSIEVIGITDLNAGLDDNFCGLNGEVNGTNTPDATQTWSSVTGLITFTSDETQLDASIQASNYGTDTLVLNADLEGVCFASDSVIITFWKEPVADAGEDQTLEFTFETNLSGNYIELGSGYWTGETGYIWNPEDSLTLVTELSPGTNTFTWTVSHDFCPSVSDEVKILVNNLFIPQAITPNGDGMNDVLIINGIGQFEHSVEIFNRWGQVVYESTDYQNDWDGTDMNGEQLSADTYFYVIKLGEDIDENGFIELKR